MGAILCISWPFCHLSDLGSDFSFQRGDFSFQRGDFWRLDYTPVLNLFQVWELYLPLWNLIIWCSFDSMARNKGYEAQDIGMVMYSDNQTNIRLCNASLRWLSIIRGHGKCYWLGAKHCGSEEFSGIMLSLMFKARWNSVETVAQ